MPILETPEFALVAITFLLIFVPRMLARFDIPMGISALVLGVLIAFFAPSMANDEFLLLFATLGIVSLFLFAGLEVEFSEIWQGRKIILQHLVIQILLLSISTYILTTFFNFQARSSIIISLAVLTPSTGFILDSLAKWNLEESLTFWVKSKAIAAEIVALVIMFFAIQSSSVTNLAVSSVVLMAMIVLIPYGFRGIARLILPHAPGSEFPMIMLMAIVCAIITKKIGAYYLVGAFIVGIIAQQFSRLVPDFSSKDTMTAIKLFAAFFIPFYFFQAGVSIDIFGISFTAILFGLGLIIIVLPIRFAINFIHRRWMLKESWEDASKVSFCMLPTLVFTLVLVNVLKDDPRLPQYVPNGLILYTIASTAMPAYLLKWLDGKTKSNSEPEPTQLELDLEKHETPPPADES